MELFSSKMTFVCAVQGRALPVQEEIQVAEGLSRKRIALCSERLSLCGRAMHLIHAMHVLGHAEREALCEW